MKKMISLLLILAVILSVAACGSPSSAPPEVPEVPETPAAPNEPAAPVAPEVPAEPTEPAEPETPAQPEEKPEPAPDPRFVAVVTTGDRVVEVETVEELEAAVDPSGTSVITLRKDITMDRPMILPYCCTLDFAGFTVRTNSKEGNGIQVEAVGSENQVTTMKNGTLFHFSAGLRIAYGGLVVDNMAIHGSEGAPICLMGGDAGTENVIRNSFLSSKVWGCFSFNRKNGDFSGVRVTVENSTLVSYKKSGDKTTPIFVRQSGVVIGELALGDGVELYTYGPAYAHGDYTRVSGKVPVKVASNASVTVANKQYSGLNHWTTTENAKPQSGTKPVPVGAEPVKEVAIPAAYTDYLVGFGRADITPAESVPLAGYGSTSDRMSTGVFSELKTTAVAITDTAGRSVILMAVDLINDRGSVARDIRKGVSEKTGVPEELILVTFSHTHSGPDLDNDSATPYMKDYRELVVSQAVAAGEAAWKDRKTAEMSVGTANVEGYNFVRHYEHQDGTYSGPGFGTSTSLIVGHAGDADPEMRIIRFTRTGHEDVVLMNWQAHGTLLSHQRAGTDEYKKVSADFVGGIREYMEKKLGCKFVYFQGAAGDINPESAVKWENKTSDIALYGKRVGDIAIKCLQGSMNAMEAGPVKTHGFTFAGPVNHADAHLLTNAQKLKTSGGTTTAAAEALGLISPHHATTIIRCSALGDTLPMPCSVISVGGVGFACAPVELFSDSGIAIREGSPCAETFILGYCNESQGYLPTQRAYDYNSYEEACTNFARGTAETLVEEFAKKWAELQ